ncbi:MAG: hypothetical protein JSR49_10600 [Proteobacteria bacterium]|nr:hypothetical protein [Pseudomonadota bacterium]
MSGSKFSDALSPLAAPPPESDDGPLTLTVHSLPSPQFAADAQRTKRGRWTMIALLLVCAAPVLASYFTYYVIRPTGRPGFGTLIEPQRPIPEATAVALDGRSVPLGSLRGQWLLLSVADAACDPACRQRLYLQHQLRESLGKNMDRLDWVWLIDDAAPVSDALAPALKSAVVLRVAPDVLAHWLPAGGDHAPTEHLYLVDPQGNLMMRFPANLDLAGASQAKRTIGRLLRAAWDSGGR